MGEKIAAIVLAAGEGKRMGSGIPKQYMLIKSRPLVYYALKAFEESAVDEVILVTGEDEIDYCKEYIVDRYHFNKVKKIVPGGWERYASVYFGLEAIEDADYVLIHDGARPMISAELIQKCIYYVKKYRACVVINQYLLSNNFPCRTIGYNESLFPYHKHYHVIYFCHLNLRF